MMSKLAVFIDVHSMYMASKTVLNAKIDYRAYLDFLSPLGECSIVKFYTLASASQAFISALRYAKLGEVVTNSNDVSMTVDIIKTCTGDDPIDKMIFGTTQLMHLPLISYIRDICNIPVTVFSPRPNPAFGVNSLVVSHSMCMGEAS